MKKNNKFNKSIVKPKSAASGHVWVWAFLFALMLTALTACAYRIYGSEARALPVAQARNEPNNQNGNVAVQYYPLQNNINNIQNNVMVKGSTGKVAYLTFDDGPSNWTPRLLEELKTLNVKATFFICFWGQDTPEKRSLIKQEAAEGHTVGVHSWTHHYSDIYKNEQNFLDDFNHMEDVIENVAGVHPRICRFPGGTGNTVSITAAHGQIMPKLAHDVDAMGFKAFDWNVSGDARSTPLPAEELARTYLNQCNGKNVVIILLHDTHQSSIKAVPNIVNALREQGYTFKTLTPDSPSMQQPFAAAASHKKKTNTVH